LPTGNNERPSFSIGQGNKLWAISEGIHDSSRSQKSTLGMRATGEGNNKLRFLEDFPTINGPASSAIPAGLAIRLHLGCEEHFDRDYP
jgi:hypothetical protein